jgi:hypothetical protein
MKKNSILLVFTLLLSSCSMTVDQFLGIPPTTTSAPTFTITNTLTEAPTFTPTVPTPTFTETPTLVGLKTKTSTPEFTSTESTVTSVGATPLPSGTSTSFVTQVPMKGFVKLSVSDEAFYKKKPCLPVSVKFTVQVTDPAAVAVVTLFVRFKSKLINVASRWTSIIMEKQAVGIGTYSHDLIPSDMKAEDLFDNAWIQYQIVSTDANSTVVGKTDVFSDRLTLLNCVPTATPTASITPTATSTASITSTVLKP